jgi:hypothetical protein
MTSANAKSTATKPPVIIYGLDPAGRPKAGRFTGPHSAAAKQAAAALKLTVCEINRPDLEELAKKLPPGRIHAQGKAFIPYIKRDLFDRLQSANEGTATNGKGASAGRAGSGTVAASGGGSVALRPSHEPSDANHVALRSGTTATSQNTNSQVFVILGFDDQHQPRGGRYTDPNLEVLIKAAASMGLCLYEIKSRDLIKLVQTLPVGRLLSNGHAEVPTIKQPLYSELISEIAVDPQAVLRGKVAEAIPSHNSLPASWDAIDVGHLVIAQETLDYGWAEAVVVGRANEILTLRYRDYPKLPKFYRHYRTVALLHQQGA